MVTRSRSGQWTFWFVFMIPTICISVVGQIVDAAPLTAILFLSAAGLLVYGYIRGGGDTANVWANRIHGLAQQYVVAGRIMLVALTIGPPAGILMRHDRLAKLERAALEASERAASTRAAADAKARRDAAESEQRTRQASATAVQLKAAVAQGNWQDADRLLGKVKELDPAIAGLPEIEAKAKPEIERVKAETAETDRRTSVVTGLAGAQRLLRDKKECKEPRSLAPVWDKLRVVRKGDSEYAAAVKLVPRLEKCRLAAVAGMLDGLRSIMAAQRKSAANNYDTKLLEQGIDAKVSVLGQYSDRIRIEYVLFSRAGVFQVTSGGSMRDDSLLGALQKIGFKKVIFTTGYGESWSYDLMPRDESDAKYATSALSEVGLSLPFKL